jgi:rieske iron-sulfur protein
LKLDCPLVADQLEIGMREVRQASDRARFGSGSTRRDFLTDSSALGLGVVAAGLGSSASAQSENERPKEGDLLVANDSEGAVPLQLNDIPVGGPPVLAWPMDPVSNTVRKGSRLNKVLLVRLDPATLVGITRERAADGVVAYSAICPHAGCEVSVWVAERRILECSCHYSHYDPHEGAAVIDGPAPRALAALPLKIAEGKLVVAKPFTARVGIAPN